MDPLWDWNTKVDTNGPGHVTNMAVMPINGKNLHKSSSLEPKGWYATLGTRVLPSLFK